jgi:beta-galactosidase/beta-glucuronidase
MFLRLAKRTLRPAILGLILVAPFALPTASASARIDLNGQWQFRTDPVNQGEQQGWYKELPAETETVRVPHTWGIGKHSDFEGTAWYFKTFALSEQVVGKHLELHFGATFYKSRVWLNGVELGGHEGGYTEYWFDVTPHVKNTNFVSIELNNQPGVATIPGWAMKLHSSKNIWYDWWPYGGIVRDAWLSVNDLAMIRRQFVRVKVEGGSANVSDHVFLEGTMRKPLEARVVLKAWAPDGGPTPAATAEQSIKLVPGTQDVTLTLKIDPAKLWGVDDPEVYRMEADLVDAKGNTLDSVTDNFGARTVELRDRKLYLNGEAVRLTGMARHEESPWVGLAETADMVVHDYDDMKNLQMTLTRPVHYPQHPAVLDYCDRHGILLIPEIPVWQFSEKQMSDPKVIELAKHMMTEMIEQAGNHPSIFAWSVCNESSTDTPGGRAYFKTMYDVIKSLDPDRYVTYADDRIAFVDNPQENSASLADFIMWNEYFGAWHGPESMLPPVFERIRRNYPDKTVIVSEFGTPGVFATDSVTADRLRVRTFRSQLEAFGKQDWIAGAIMWCYQDYKSHRNLWPGYTAGYVDHGVVDENRQRRPSYDVWQELNAPAHVKVQWKFEPSSLPFPVGFSASIERRRPDEIPSYTLRNYRVAWELRDDDGNKLSGDEKDLPEIGTPQSIDSGWLPQKTKSLHLSFWLYRPTGFVALDKKLDWLDPRAGGLNLEEMKKEGMKIPE